MTQDKRDPKKVTAGRAGGKIGGKIGGKSTSEAKKRASRANGIAGGGRPKGIPITPEHARKAAADVGADMSGLVPVTIYLTPSAHGMLVAMAAYDERDTLEELIQHQLSTDVSSWLEGVSADHCEDLFLRGGVGKKKGGA